MPRPGPRPYECVRRAWHSDRHQPMRGSLIQEIFRVVNEIHSSATKKNQEWQEKLPIVVLKAEEILYSKANSEAEYMDLATLWDRANDAIDTIVRRDESTETGNLLLPCIEAALHLGCTPRRASRSQRNITPGCYLSASTSEVASVPTTNLESTSQGNYRTNGQLFSHYSSFMKPIMMTSNRFISESHNRVTPNNIFPSDKYPSLPEKFPLFGDHQRSPKKTKYSSNSYSVYPLYYESQLQFNFCNLSKTNSLSTKPSEMDVTTKPFSDNVDASNVITQLDLGDTSENPPVLGCDLSLRLGPSVVPCISFENSWPQEVEDVDSNPSQEGNKYRDLSPPLNKDFSFFLEVNADEALESCLSKEELRNEILNVEAMVRKRKEVLNYPAKDKQIFWPSKLPFSDFGGRTSNAG